MNASATERPLQVNPVAGREMVGRRGGVHDGVELSRLEPGRFERAPRCLVRQSRSGLALAYPAALLDPGARPDPFIARVHECGEVVVGDDAIGHGEAGAEEAGAGHGGSG
jgi:hypothetical protein